jgi:hypothetical protein
MLNERQDLRQTVNIAARCRTTTSQEIHATGPVTTRRQLTILQNAITPIRSRRIARDR